MKLELTPTQVVILRLLKRNGPSTRSRICLGRRMEARARYSQALYMLLSMGLVEDTWEVCHRARRFSLTKKGEARLDS